MQAAEILDRLLAEKGITEDELVEEFRQLRRGDIFFNYRNTERK